LGSKKAGLISDSLENYMILKKISIGKRPFIGVSYISGNITDIHGGILILLRTNVFHSEVEWHVKNVGFCGKGQCHAWGSKVK
jgi:hypothetical protein